MDAMVPRDEIRHSRLDICNGDHAAVQSAEGNIENNKNSRLVSHKIECIISNPSCFISRHHATLEGGLAYYYFSNLEFKQMVSIHTCIYQALGSDAIAHFAQKMQGHAVRRSTPSHVVEVAAVVFSNGSQPENMHL